MKIALSLPPSWSILARLAWLAWSLPNLPPSRNRVHSYFQGWELLLVGEMKEQECAAVGVKLVEEHRLAEVLDVYLRLAPAVSAADRTARATVPCVP